MEKTGSNKSCKEIALILDIGERRVQQLAKAGHIPKIDGKRGRYPLVGSIQGYIKYLRSLSLELDADSDIANAKLRVEKARAEILELDAAQKASELVHKDHVAQVWGSITGLIKAKLLSLPSKAAGDVFASRNINEVRATLENSIDEVLIELSDTDVESYDNTSANGKHSGDNTSSNDDVKTTTKVHGKSMGRQK